MRLGYLTHFHPGETYYVDLKKHPPWKGRWGIRYAKVSFFIWPMAHRLHLTDWPHPRFLTTFVGSEDDWLTKKSDKIE